MKKLLITGSILLLTGLTILSCRKEQLNPANGTLPAPSEQVNIGEVFATQQQLKEKRGLEMEATSLVPMGLYFTNEGRFLNFSSRLQFEQVVVNPSESTENSVYAYLSKIGHKSWFDVAQKSADLTIKDLIKDDYFASLLSADRTIKIGAFIYKINPQDEKVLALHESRLNQYLDLVMNNYEAANMLVFSTSQDVLDMTDKMLALNITDRVPPVAAALGCNEDYCGGRDATTRFTFSNKYKATITVDHHNHYNRFGIYYSLVAYSDRYGSNPDYNYGMWIQVENRWYKPRCRSIVGPYSHPWRADRPVNNATQVYKTYSDTRALNGLHLKTRGRIEENNRPEGNNPYTTFFTNWVEICVNSPYC